MDSILRLNTATLDSFKNYLANHHISEIYGAILGGLAIHQPEKPLKFVLEKLQEIDQQGLEPNLSQSSAAERSIVSGAALNLEHFIGHLHPALKKKNSSF